MTAGPGASFEAAYAYCEALLREHDKDRFLADLFVPADVRPGIHALHAFSFEIARIRDLVSEPMPGEIRHQWWRDLLEGSAPGAANANPVATAVSETVDRFCLSRAPLTALIDARGFDLYDDPMPDISTLEGYCRDTSSVLFRLVAEILDARQSRTSTDERDAGAGRSLARRASPLLATAADHAGLAYAFTGLIRAFAGHAARGRLYLPSDILRRHGSSPEEALGGRSTPALLTALDEWRREARRHLATALAAVERLAEGLKPAFLPLALIEPYLGLTEKSGYDPFRSPVELPQWRRQWALWRGLRVAPGTQE